MPAPVATYRLQLHEAFTLDDAARVAADLRRLGISHLYLSPITQATRGSEHGYDVTDPTRVSEELGGERALERLAALLRDHGMHVLLDIVPNHMAASAENPWWADLLARGPASEHARVFDTPWAADADERLMLPVLGAPAEEVLAAGELHITEHGGRRTLQYHEQWFPLPDGPGAAGSATVTRALLDSLPYELVDWRTAQERLSYRRFFDITGLIGVRVEDAAVFERTHAGILRWVEQGWIDALRIDHIDGLRDPAGYLAQLAEATAQARGGTRCYTVVEKILAADEHVPHDWDADGTTGYEFMRMASAFFVDPAGYRRLDQLRRDVTGEARPFDDVVHDCKREVLDALFRPELTDVAERLAAVADLPAETTREVLHELTAALGVYRTYISDAGVSVEDRLRIEAARDAVRGRLPAHQHATLDTVCATLLLDRTHDADEARTHTLDVIARWQQLTGPAMAKGFEDTALYRWPTLLAMNEVGGEPEDTADADALHDFFTWRADHEPGALNATSSHDSKRSGDVRARLLVLSECAADWSSLVEDALPRLRAPGAAIAPRDELVLLQTLVGAWPLDAQPDEELTSRVQAYMRKAAREAKEETSWLEPDGAYEKALDDTVQRVLADPAARPLRDALQAFVERIALHGAMNSLAQVLLKCAAPGVPDTYQGTERWRFDLVDPDNRRPVDFAQLARYADELEPIVARPTAAAVQSLLGGWRDGRIKQYVLMAAQACRARNAAFAGGYEPLTVTGRHAAHVLTFRRGSGASSAVAIVPRWPARLAAPDAWPVGAVWDDASVECGRGPWRCALTGARFDAPDGRVRLADALGVLPLSLLEPV